MGALASGRARLAGLVCGSLLLGGCAAPEPPTVAHLSAPRPKRPSEPGLAPTREPPADAAPRVFELGAPPRVDDVPLAGPIEPLAIRSRRIRVPGAGTFIDIDATGRDDVWLLDGRLFRFSGGAAVRQSPLCEGADFRPETLRVSETHVVLAGSQTLETPGVPRVDSTYVELVRGGRARCVRHPDGSAYHWQVASTVVPGAAWAHAPGLGRWESWSTDGGPISLPDLEEGEWPTIWQMIDRQRGWVMVGTRDAEACAPVRRLWESRGAGWVPRPGLEGGALEGGCLADVWIDAQAGAWFAGSVLAVHRSDHWEVFALPEGFVAGHVEGSGPEDVWLADERRLLHFDGTRFRSAEVPISRLTAMKYVPGSGLWVVGGPEPERGDEGGARPTVGEVAIITLDEARDRRGASPR